MFQFSLGHLDDYNLRLAVLAGIVCLLASAVAISLFHRARSREGTARLAWISLDALAAGCGIWATHFIAMLAYKPMIGAGYDLTLTAVSLLLAVLFTGVGFGIALVGSRRLTSVAGGIIVGLGIATMHYTGMAALDLPNHMFWSVDQVVVPISLGVVFGVLTVHFANRDDSWTNFFSALVFLTLAIVLMHQSAMGAMMVMPDSTIGTDSNSLPPQYLSLIVASVTVIILSMCLVAALSDRMSQSKLQQQKDLIDTALENMSQGLCMFDADSRVELYNERYAALMGTAGTSLVGLTLLELIKYREAIGEFSGNSQEFFDAIMADVSTGTTHTKTITTRHGRSLRVTDQPRAGGGWVATFDDITEWVDSQARIAHMAQHDALTDLANRTQLIKKLDESIARVSRGGGQIAVHFIDLDRFKKVNDTLGHDAGDFLLKTVAERLREVTRSGDMVARLGGDEFVVVQTAVENAKQAEEFAGRLTAAISKPVMFDEQQIAATVSLGFAIAPADGKNSERLLKSADLALYKAKADGRNCVRCFLPEMDADLEERTKLERLIRDAVLHDRFELHYQPLMEMSGHGLIGFEALVRMKADDGTLVAPMTFIPLAEELGLIDKIGAWVLQEACRTAAKWPDHLTVAVNLSPSQFLAGGISTTVADALKDAGLAANRLELEITEALLLVDSAEILAELQRLKAMGVAIVMDDFGTGYSSLSYLWKFPFDKIKIDRSFMQGFDGSGRDAETVVKTIIALGRELHMQVTVEGVETANQADFLQRADGDQVQGFFFGRPIPSGEVGAKILKEFQKAGLAPTAAASSREKPARVKSNAK